MTHINGSRTKGHTTRPTTATSRRNTGGGTFSRETINVRQNRPSGAGLGLSRQERLRRQNLASASERGRTAGSPLSTRLFRTGRGTLSSIENAVDTGPTAQEIADAFFGGGGGGGGRSQADEIALIREQARLGSEESARDRATAIQQAELNRAFEIDQDRKQQEEERRQQAASIQSERQRVYTDLLGRDPVRAILFAMGIGPEADIFSTQLKSLGSTQTPLAGAGQGRLQTETALSGLLGRSVQLGTGGVTGLGSAEQAAQPFQSGGADIQKLLTSAFGVGGTKGAGISAEELIQRISAVTPTGTLQQ